MLVCVCGRVCECEYVNTVFAHKCVLKSSIYLLAYIMGGGTMFIALIPLKTSSEVAVNVR